MCVCRILKYVEINGIPAYFNGRFQFQLDRFLSIEYVWIVLMGGMKDKIGGKYESRERNFSNRIKIRALPT